MRAYAALSLALLLAACGSAPPAPVSDKAGSATVLEGPARARSATPAVDGPSYTVKKGDTLYQIALDHGQDHRELAQWNNLDNPNRLITGQVLRLTPPTPVAAPVGDASVEVKPVTAPAPVQARPVDVAPAGTPTAMAASGNSASYKRGPKGGTLPYSDEVLAQHKQMESGEQLAVAATPAPASTATPAPAATAVTPAVAPAPPAPAAASAPTWVWPVPGKLLSPFNEATTKGIDLAGKRGEPVMAAAAGKVSYVGSSLRGYGKMVVLKHSSEFLSVYAHNDKVVVNEGQSVSAGQKIAELGSTDTDSPKLHFEIRRQGKPVDPAGLLPPR